MFTMRQKNINQIQDVIESHTGMSKAEFLYPEENPYLYGLDAAVSCLVKHANRQVTIVGDYDVDGICATAIIYFGLKRLGIRARTRLPHRLTEGYGLSEKIIEEIADGVVITVDNGIAATKAIEKAKEKGLIVIVTDHHLAVRDKENQRILPPADVIVDPNAEDISLYKDYCGAAIAFRFVQELLKSQDENLDDLLVLASIATVCDVMQLTGANRLLVKKGLELINHEKGVLGLRKLLELIQLTDHITEEDYGYRIGPILNAAGRLYDTGAESVLRVLKAEQDGADLEIRVDQLIQANEKRKSLVEYWMPIVDRLANKERPIVIYHPDIEEGIIGIIAGKLQEMYQCPVIVFTKDHEENLKGSGRSIEGYHLKHILDQMQDCMIKYGGHEGAAGLTVRAGGLQEFKKRFVALVGSLPEMKEVQEYDLRLNSSNLHQVMQDLNTFAPYGTGNPKPVLKLQFQVKKENYRRIGNGKSFMIMGKDLSLIAFGLTEKYEDSGMPSLITCIGHLKENWYRGKCYYRFEVINFIDSSKE